MARLTDLELAKAFVRESTPSFAEVIARIERRTDLKPDRRRDMISGLKRVADAFGHKVEEIPADPVWLRPRIENVKPAALGISKKTWTNILSNMKSALAEAGIVERDRGSPIELSPAWRTVWDLVLAAKIDAISIPLSRPVRFFSNMGIAPEDVTDEAFAAFQRALELSEIRKDPASATWQGIHAWNKAVDAVLGWPQIRLTKPIRHNHFAIPLAEFPTPFREELDALLVGLARPSLKRGSARRNPLSPRTIEHRGRQWHRFASALVHAGVPIETLTSLDVLLDLDHVEPGIEWLAENRHGGKASAGLHEMALGLCTLGRELGIEGDHLEQLREYARLLSGKKGGRKVRKKGPTDKNRQRLRQFRDPAKRDALLRLPSVLIAEARKTDHPIKAARIAEVAVAIAIETMAPIRLKNLAELEIDRHFDRTVPGKLYLTIPEYEVKNGAPLEFDLPERVRELLDTFLADFRPYLIAGPCPWLFAREDGTGHVHQTVLARRVTETIAERLGIEMNMHLFRHLAATLILDRDPGAYDLVRRILGHAELSTTMDAYVGMEAPSATRFLSELVETAHEQAPSRALTRKRSRR